MKSRFIELHTAEDNFEIWVNIQHIRIIGVINSSNNSYTLKSHPEANSTIFFSDSPIEWVRETHEEIMKKIRRAQSFIHFK